MNQYQTISWIFCAIFFLLGLLNMIYVHIVPGTFYILLCLLYLPRTNSLLKTKVGVKIPFMLKVILGITILWTTLAVGDLMEIFEAWLNR